jgi:hypothetical protein
VFLERYLDVAKKYMFDTYEVSNTEEVKKAIEDNGDLKVQFFKESNPTLVYGSVTTYNNSNPFTLTNNTATYNGYLNLTGGITSTYSTNGLINCGGSLTSNVTNDSFEDIKQKPRLRKSLTKSIETGRVEAGSSSDQKFEYVNKSFDYYAFHTVECKLITVSKKINTAEDINVKRYCTNCGTKQKPEFKFCPSCGKKC